MIQLYLVRHGETIENRDGIVQGHIGGTLTSKGVRQSKRAAKKLAKIEFDAIYSSDLDRAMQTAEFIAKYHPNLQIIKEYRLREIDFGIMQGKPSKRMNQEGMPGWEIFKTDFWNARIEEGETNTELYRRVIGFVNELIAGKFKSVVLVTHGGPIRHIIAAAKGLDAAPLFGKSVGNAEITEVFLNQEIELKH